MNKPIDDYFTFIDRRINQNRRNSIDLCKQLNIDLYHRKRRKSQDRRDGNKTLLEDYYDYMKTRSSVSKATKTN